MKFFKLLETLLKLGKPVKSDIADLLGIEIEKGYGQAGLRLLHQVLISMDLKNADLARDSLKVSVWHQAALYGEWYNPALYQALLPVCQLAYLSENNGIAEEHAFKLATIFQDQKAALTYLFACAKNIASYEFVVHDGCLFV